MSDEASPPFARDQRGSEAEFAPASATREGVFEEDSDEDSLLSQARPEVELRPTHSRATPTSSLGNASRDSGYGADTDTSTPSTVSYSERYRCRLQSDWSEAQGDGRSEGGQSSTFIRFALTSRSWPNVSAHAHSYRLTDTSHVESTDSNSATPTSTLVSQNSSTPAAEAGEYNYGDASPGITEESRQSNDRADSHAGSRRQNDVLREQQVAHEARAGKRTTATARCRQPSHHR
jgi:hypothetical protein